MMFQHLDVDHRKILKYEELTCIYKSVRGSPSIPPRCHQFMLRSRAGYSAVARLIVIILLKNIDYPILLNISNYHSNVLAG